MFLGEVERVKSVIFKWKFKLFFDCFDCCVKLLLKKYFFMIYEVNSIISIFIFKFVFVDRFIDDESMFKLNNVYIKIF